MESFVEAFVAEACGVRFTVNPFLHGTIQWQGLSGVLSGLGVVPGGKKVTRPFQFYNAL